jgi:hypothetical protein
MHLTALDDWSGRSWKCKFTTLRQNVKWALYRAEGADVSSVVLLEGQPGIGSGNQ